MKSLSAFLLNLILISCVHSQPNYKKNITDSFAVVPGQTIICVHNITGNVKVVSGKSEIVKVTATETFYADNEEELKQAKEEVKFLIEQRNDKWIIRPDAPFINFREDGNFNWLNCNTGRVDYDFRYDITLEVPDNLFLRLRTVNDGVVSVENVKAASIDANNVNGEIYLENVSGAEKISTVNGDIKVVYARNPDSNTSFHSVNGDIEISYKKDFSGDVFFKSMNGDFYTNFNKVKSLPNYVRSEASKTTGKFVMKISEEMKFQIGKEGGKEHRFDTLNGNVYLKDSSI